MSGDGRRRTAIARALMFKERRRLRTHLGKLRLGTSEARPQGAGFLKYTLVYDRHRVSRYSLPATWKPVVGDLERAMEKYWAPD
ncbi:hypothetical protein ABZW11_04115 [Nonomuraea sp. NPDC004580]|uniref:hypothetical protein n=1 Tax=Nonomuraea sp. NPDC004580 TaxID=3154552 RepID=UPI0033BE625E